MSGSYSTGMKGVRLSAALARSNAAIGFGAIVYDSDALSYVADRPSVAAVLSDAKREIVRVFGGDAFLRAALSYEQGDDEPLLVVEIQSNRHRDDAARKLDEFDDEWWLDNAPRAPRVVIMLRRP